MVVLHVKSPPLSLSLFSTLEPLSKVKCMSTHTAHLAVSAEPGLRTERRAGFGNINDCGERNHHAELLAGVREEPCQPLSECECAFVFQ